MCLRHASGSPAPRGTRADGRAARLSNRPRPSRDAIAETGDLASSRGDQACIRERRRRQGCASAGMRYAPPATSVIAAAAPAASASSALRDPGVGLGEHDVKVILDYKSTRRWADADPRPAQTVPRSADLSEGDRALAAQGWTSRRHQGALALALDRRLFVEPPTAGERVVALQLILVGDRGELHLGGRRVVLGTVAHARCQRQPGAFEIVVAACDSMVPHAPARTGPVAREWRDGCPVRQCRWRHYQARRLADEQRDRQTST